MSTMILTIKGIDLLVNDCIESKITLMVRKYSETSELNFEEKM